MSIQNCPEERLAAAKALVEYYENYQFTEGEEFNFIVHSHGGNVLKEFTQLWHGRPIDNIVFLGTPHRDDYFLNYSKLAPNANLINVYDRGDWVQTTAAQTFYPPNLST
jgi:hypothetical protein